MAATEVTGTGHRVTWPEGKAFAFTVFDDTDLATIDNVKPVYDFLEGLGFRTTKSVWSLAPDYQTRLGGSTAEDPAYLAWTQAIQAQGFEIASHGASPHTTPRGRVELALDRFREYYGHDPYSLANHSGARESIYWGDARVGGLQRVAYNAMTMRRNVGRFRGHVEGDPLFWGDLCQERVRYVRNFTFDAIDTLAACPYMPYHDPQRPFVNAWFASAEATNVDVFCRRVDEASQDTLEASGGASIIYAHFASGFYRDGRLDARFRKLMERLAAKDGWFVPVGTLLDHLAGDRGPLVIDGGQRRLLERRWLRSKARVGYS